ncbi:hypothetical protein [Desulfonatronum thiosulfatophilum]|uniref:hypothetical protein n=1 Tax=Desulfonatronum thiosulfatophilum TaxID=617002 RepID=UPI001294817D|nr:hypothetical protein [Desulfonatronum thiosulfatophilum]
MLNTTLAALVGGDPRGRCNIENIHAEEVNLGLTDNDENNPDKLDSSRQMMSI